MVLHITARKLPVHYVIYILADTLQQICYGRSIRQSITADVLRQMHDGSSIAADTLNITATILQQTYFGRYIIADILQQILRQIRYGRYIAHHKNGHILPNLQRQKLSVLCSNLPIATHRPKDSFRPFSLTHGRKNTRTTTWHREFGEVVTVKPETPSPSYTLDIYVELPHGPHRG